LHGLTPATRAAQVRLYDEALTAVTKGREKATTGQAPWIRAYYARHR